MARKPNARFTRINVGGDAWFVPGGFGRLYREEARHQTALFREGKPGDVVDRIRSLLAQIGYRASVEAVHTWPLRKRVEAVVYAQNVHLRASDNPIQRHPRPDWLPEPWTGPMVGEGAFEGPAPTELRA